MATKAEKVAEAQAKVKDLKAKQAAAAAVAAKAKADADAAAVLQAEADALEASAETDEAEDEQEPDDVAPAAEVAADPAAPADATIHMPDGVFDIPRKDGDAPKSTMTVEDLHPVALDAAQDEHGVAQDWVEPYPEKGVVNVMFTIETPIGRTWYQKGDVATIPAELAHSIFKQITAVKGVDDNG